MDVKRGERLKHVFEEITTALPKITKIWVWIGLFAFVFMNLFLNSLLILETFDNETANLVLTSLASISVKWFVALVVIVVGMLVFEIMHARHNKKLEKLKKKSNKGKKENAGR